VILSKEGSDGDLGVIGTGIWCGIPFAVSGIVGIHAAKKPSKCR